MKKELIFQVGDRPYSLGRETWIMGILNVTPDSFSDGGRYVNTQEAVHHGLHMLAEGADILDIGGESTRPGAASVSAEEEAARVIPVIQELRRNTSALISVDTTKSLVLAKALDAGADILNDISAMRFDPDMLPLAVENQIPAILMHMRGTPETMNRLTQYGDLLSDIKDFFCQRTTEIMEAGLKKEHIIIDPGIGFAKDWKQNLQLIRNLDVFSDLDVPLLIGVSRKSFIGRVLDVPPDDRLEGTIAACLLAVQAGAHILRVHDVAAVKRAIRVAEAILAQPHLTGPHESHSKKEGTHVH